MLFKNAKLPTMAIQLTCKRRNSNHCSYFTSIANVNAGYQAVPAKTVKSPYVSSASLDNQPYLWSKSSLLVFILKSTQLLMFRPARYYSIGSHQVSWEIDQRPLRKSLCWVFCVKRRSNSPSLVFEDGDAPQKEKNQALAGKSHNLLDSRLTV